MSRNIPVRDEEYNRFISFKESLKEILNDKKLTNDKLLDMLMTESPHSEQVTAYQSGKASLIKKIGSGNNGNK